MRRASTCEGRRRAAAFTLIEIIISLSISLAILSLAAGIVVGAMRDARRSRVRAELARDAQLLDRLLRTELPQIGLGMPTSHHLDGAYGTAGSTFYGPVMVAAPSELGFIADLPRPDAQMNAFGILPNQPLGGRDRIFWLNDSTGSCLPDDDDAKSCTLAASSLMFPDDFSSPCTEQASDRGCPWSMKRLVPGEPFQIVAGDGTWTHALMPATPSLAFSSSSSSSSSSRPRVVALQLDQSWSAVWPNLTPGHPPGGLRGQGYVTTIDRVFYAFVGATVVRVQCWGDPDPQHPDWPGPTATSIPPLSELRLDLRTPGGSGTTQTCTDAEVVARHVKTVRFGYFDALGNELVAIDTAVEKASVRRIDYDIVLERDHDGQPLQEQLTGSVAIRNP